LPTFNLTLNCEHNADEVIAELQPIPEELTKAMREGTDEAAQALQRQIAEIMLRRAGGVYWEINSEVQPSSDGASATIVTPHSKPHLIVPKDKKALRFEIEGREIFAKYVNHPGSKPLDWATEVETTFPPEFRRIYAERVQQVLGDGGPSAMPVGSL